LAGSDVKVVPNWTFLRGISAARVSKAGVVRPKQSGGEAISRILEVALNLPDRNHPQRVKRNAALRGGVRA